MKKTCVTCHYQRVVLSDIPCCVCIGREERGNGPSMWLEDIDVFGDEYLDHRGECLYCHYSIRCKEMWPCNDCDALDGNILYWYPAYFALEEEGTE